MAMSSDFRWVFPGGRLNQVVTQAVLVNNTALNILKTVPTDRRWAILSAKMVNADDVTRSCKIEVWKEAAKTNQLAVLAYKAALAVGGLLHYPNNITGSEAAQQLYGPCILGEGNSINFYWAAGGASTGATDDDGCVLCYLEIPAR